MDSTKKLSANWFRSIVRYPFKWTEDEIYYLDNNINISIQNKRKGLLDTFDILKRKKIYTIGGQGK